MIDDAVIEAIIKISNDKNLINRLEPNLSLHLKIQRWMVLRIMEAQRLLNEQWRANGKDTSGRL